jgi:hypothetical protein
LKVNKIQDFGDTEIYLGCVGFIGVVLGAKVGGVYFVTSFGRAALCRMVNARTGGGPSILEVGAF